ncbi:eukaryotic initiation factor 4A-like [Gigantopelta aegis]|uniref:eukaryotic initiation factor 4A-like n=1 Tax=Gigantopelta aegis TaxID=1735272 RepID=UPI001B88887D|nr:eukaryotic initiation factor 4A-like [Gigantopelta aegis]XP_041350472.1 eukaryotic initiation factor 4A-like [Gigantopelta aegis]
MVDRFENMHLRVEILTAIKDFGFDVPSQVEGKSVVTCIKGENTVIQAPSGTGKTTAAVLALLQNIDYKNAKCQAVILCSTRELALSVQAVVTGLGKYVRVKCRICEETTQDGGILVARTTMINVHVIIGMPCHVLEAITKKVIDTDCVKMMILDNVDQMISRAMTEQICDIHRHLTEAVQTIALLTSLGARESDLVSWTMSESVLVDVCDNTPSLENVRQYYVQVEREEWKLETLTDLLETLGPCRQTVVYCNTNSQVDWLAQEMRARDWLVNVLHDGMSAASQEQMRTDFISGSVRLLVTTDTMASGNHVPVCMNYGLPAMAGDYLYRFGTTDKTDRRRLVISLITDEDREKLSSIELFCNTSINELPASVTDLV